MDKYTCHHYTSVFVQLVDLMEHMADVQNTLATECEGELVAHLSKTMFRDLKSMDTTLETFLESHDPTHMVRRPEFVLLPPTEEL